MQGIQHPRKSPEQGEEAVVAVVEFLSAFTLFLMILTAFMSLAQLELGSNDPYSDLIDRSAVDGLDRLTNGEGWYVPYVDGVRDQANATEEWHLVPVTNCMRAFFNLVLSAMVYLIWNELMPFQT